MVTSSTCINARLKFIFIHNKKLMVTMTTGVCVCMYENRFTSMIFITKECTYICITLKLTSCYLDQSILYLIYNLSSIFHQDQD